MAYDAKYDLNKDGVIDEMDISLLTHYFGTAVDPTDPLSVACDLNGDGYIDISDYSLFNRYADMGSVAATPIKRQLLPISDAQPAPVDVLPSVPVAKAGFPWWIAALIIGGIILGAKKRK